MVGCYERGRAITAEEDAPQWKSWGGDGDGDGSGSDSGSSTSEEGR